MYSRARITDGRLNNIAIFNIESNVDKLLKKLNRVYYLTVKDKHNIFSLSKINIYCEGRGHQKPEYVSGDKCYCVLILEIIVFLLAVIYIRIKYITSIIHIQVN